jgi:transposase
MAKPYSYDFRKKVIAAIEMDGRKKCEVSEIFGISRNTIDLWLKRKEETGDIAAKPIKPSTAGHKITDWEKFRKFVVENSSKTQSQMAKLWEGEISSRTISRALAQIGFTRKSGCNRAEVSSACVAPSGRVMGTANEMKPSVKYFWSN